MIQPGKECPEPGLVTLKDVEATFEKLPFTGFPPGLGLGIFYKPDYLYDKITFPSGRAQLDGQAKLDGVILHIYTLPFGIQPPYVEQDLFYPVIFIHGLGGNPQDWVTGNKSIYWNKFLDEGYPEDFLATYSYADADENPETYDYQGDVTKIDDDLPALVDEMAVKFENQYGDPPTGGCNDSCVDLVGFSLGGIVSRQYLNEHPLSNKIRKVVTIASPHQGSFLLGPENWFDSLPFFGAFLKRAFIESANAVFAAKTTIDQSQPIDLAAPATQQVIPGSSFLDLLNDIFYTRPKFEVVYGDIDMQFRQKLFHWELATPKFSIGDVVIGTQSATAIPAQDLVEHEFSDEQQTFSGDILLLKKQNIYQYQLDFVSTDEFKYFHLALPRQEEVVDKVVETLRS